MSKSKSEPEAFAADRDLYSGLIRLHVLHHAVEGPVFGLGMIEELAHHDILAQLQLRDPDKYIVSFHRPNLRYLVKRCEETEQQSRLLLAALRAHDGENAIVYAPTIARVEDTVDYLAERGIAAVPYHGQMDPPVRKRNQERWMSDEVRVLVGTIAFGLGINKPGVRAVIHLSLPKSVEQYYQEAGRAGRDGLPADCALLWQKKDLGLLAFFINSMTDSAEQKRAWTRYREVLRFAESGVCRHRQICVHFGEAPKWAACEMCDICRAPPDWLAARHTPTAVKDKKKSAPARGVAIADEGMVDRELLDYMREWRRRVSVEENVAAFMVLHDSGLEDLCRKKPGNANALLSVSGIGERKARLYGPAILTALQAFGSGERAVKRENSLESPAEATTRLLNEGRSFEEIAKIRDRRLNTIIDTIAELVEKGRLDFDEKWIGPEKQALIEDAIARVGPGRMKPIKDLLPEDVTYGEIRLMVSRSKRAGKSE